MHAAVERESYLWMYICRLDTSIGMLGVMRESHITHCSRVKTGGNDRESELGT